MQRTKIWAEPQQENNSLQMVPINGVYEKKKTIYSEYSGLQEKNNKEYSKAWVRNYYHP